MPSSFTRDDLTILSSIYPDATLSPTSICLSFPSNYFTPTLTCTTDMSLDLQISSSTSHRKTGLDFSSFLLRHLRSLASDLTREADAELSGVVLELFQAADFACSDVFEELASDTGDLEDTGSSVPVSLDAPGENQQISVM